METEGGFELPLVNISPDEVWEAFFVHQQGGETEKDAILKLQTWIVNFTEEQVKPLRDSELFSADEIEEIRAKVCVISPITLTLYLHWLQLEEFSKLSNSEKERYLLERMPDRLKARFRGNAASRNAREVSEDEASSETDMLAEENEERRLHMTFEEFLKMFGLEVQKQKGEENGRQ